METWYVWIGLGVGVILIWLVVRSIRRLHRRIELFKKEELDLLARQNPYLLFLDRMAAQREILAKWKGSKKRNKE